ncbi:type IV secretory system conjugative DNA transfer family protein [Micromonospora sp. CP22]|uniref:type IV secretory system conjugative DNA transfer family protein n=1 Tax=Micromonospora sp. CP22 TaxID=2580517 RepID=UPI0018AD27AA|nr:type IV secretory system conjugative DNA transfer family protein [Micromonospora sp. CP22]
MINRVVEISCTVDGRPSRGTGLLIAPGVVLTAAHVVDGAEPADIEVRRADTEDPRAWTTATARILSADPDLDAAVVLLDTIWDHVDGDEEPIEIAHIDVDEPLPFRAIGFPDVQTAEPVHAEERRDLEDVRGVTAPYSADRQKLLSLDVTSARPLNVRPARRRDESGWAGLSGAAVWSSGLLVGVIVTDNRAFDGGSRLEAVPVTRLLADRDLQEHLPRSWEHTGARRISNLLSFSVGNGQVIRIRAAHRSFGPQLRENLRTSLTALLHVEYQLVPFTGRSVEFAQLRQWCAAPARVSYAVVSGPAGSGKTRLAAELCRQAAADGWVAGIANFTTEPAQTRLDAVPRPVLIVVDYVDNTPDTAADLLLGCLTGGARHPVRIVFLARSATAFLPRLHAAMGLESHDPALDLRLAQQQLDDVARYQHYLVARAAFSRLRGLPEPDQPTGSATTDLAAPAEPPADLVPWLRVLSTPLLLHARALLDLLPPPAPTEAAAVAASPADRHDIDDLLDRLLDREDREFWAPTLLRHGLDSSGPRMDVFAVATFAGADTDDEARFLLDQVDTLRGDDARVERLLQHLRETYGGAPLPSVRPDLLGERLIARQLIARDQVPRLFGDVDRVGQRSRMLEVLLRMLASPSTAAAQSARQVLTRLLDERLPELARQVNDPLPDGSTPTSDAYLFAARIATALEQIEVPRAAAEASTVTFRSQARLHKLAAAVLHQAATHYQQTDDPARAIRLLQDTTNAYLRLGQPDAATQSSDEALGYLRRAPQLGQDNQLGRLLSTTSLVRMGTGNVEAAIETGRQAVALAEAASRDDPDGHLAALAEARRHLALAYLAAGQHRAAVTTLHEAVHQPGLLPSLEAGRLRMAYAMALLATADLPGALSQAAQAVDRFRTATPPRPVEMSAASMLLANLRALAGELEEAQHEVEVAITIADSAPDDHDDEVRFNRASIRLGAGSLLLQVDQEAARRYLREARQIFQELSGELPDQFEFAYAMTRIAYAEALYQLDDVDAALREIRAADAMVEDLYARHPRRMYVLPVIAAKTRAALYFGLDRLPEAVDAISGAIDRLTDLDPIGGRAHLGELYTLLGLLRLETEEFRAALQAAERAVTEFQRLSEDEPRTYLIQTLSAHLLQLAAAARLSDEGFEAEADDSVRRLTDSLRDQARTDEHRQYLALVLYLRAKVRHEQGDVDGAIVLAQEAIGVFEVMSPLFPGYDDDRQTVSAELDEWLRERDGGRTDLVVTPTGSSSDTLDMLVVEPDLRQRRHRVVLGRHGDQLIAAVPFRPVLVLGPQRSRKTTSMVIPTLLEWDGPAVVTSIRTDVLSGTVRHRAAMGEVAVFEPAERLVHGSLVRKWNPIDDCRTWEGTVLTARSLVEAGRLAGQSGVRDEQFWYNMANQLLEALLYAAAATGCTMGDVHRWVKTMDSAEVSARLTIALRRGADGANAVRAFAGIRALAPQTMTSVYATTTTLLTAYSSEAVRRNSESDFRVDDFFDGRANTLYLCAPPEDQRILAPIFTTLIQRVIAEAYRRHNRGERHLPLLLLLDEAGNIARLENLDTLATSAAGTDIQLVTVFHDLAQMEAMYGEYRANSIANNHSALLLLPGNRDQRTQQLYRSLLSDDLLLGARHRSLRQIKPGTALCVYDHLSADVITLRSSSHDRDLRDYAGPPVVGDEGFAPLLAFNANRLVIPGGYGRPGERV